MEEGKKTAEKYVKAKTEYYTTLIETLEKRSSWDWSRFKEIGGRVPDNIFDLFIIMVECMMEDNKLADTKKLYEPYKAAVDDYMRFAAEASLVSDMNGVIHKYGFDNVEGIIKEGRRMLNEKAREAKDRSVR